MLQIPVEPAITEYLHRKAVAARIPLSGTFELTSVCNMNCKMCYVRMSAEEQQAIRPLRSVEEWLSLAKKAREAGLLYLLLTGGEPFLYPGFRELLTGLQKMGFLISINSNGTMINEETVAWLKECPPMRISITLYGASDETYSRLCGNPHGYTQTVKAIQLLRDAGISVKLNCSITPYNASDLPAIMAFAADEKLVIQSSAYMFPPLRRDAAMVGKNCRFTPEEAAHYTALAEYLQSGKEAFLSRSDQDLPPLPDDSNENCAETGEMIRCRAGKSSFWITWEGEMMPCGMFPCTHNNNVFEKEFTDCWKQVTQRVDEIRLPAKCANCNLKDACKACAAMVITESGCFDKVPEYRCRMAHAYPQERQIIKKRLLDGTMETW